MTKRNVNSRERWKQRDISVRGEMRGNNETYRQRNSHSIIMAAIRSSISSEGFCMPLNSARSSTSMSLTTFLVSATIAIALYTALSWATWYSGSRCLNKQIIFFVKVIEFRLAFNVLFFYFFYAKESESYFSTFIKTNIVLFKFSPVLHFDQQAAIAL